jgi:hypothetical protein
MEKPNKIQDSFFCGGMSKEQINALVGFLDYKYSVGVRVLVHESCGFFWAKVVEQTYGFWGSFGNMLRPEYIIETEQGTLCCYPENWLETEDERSDKRLKIRRLMEKANTQDDNDVKEALVFLADAIDERMYS